jgi:hypothetical protein
MADQPDMQQSDHPEHLMPPTEAYTHDFDDSGSATTPSSSVNRSTKSNNERKSQSRYGGDWSSEYEGNADNQIGYFRSRE